MAENGLDMSSEAIKKRKKAQERNDKLIIMRLELDQRALTIRKDRELHRQRREREALEKQKSSEDFEKRPSLELQQQQQLAAEEELKLEELRKEKRKEKIIEQSPEIATLRSHIKGAYTKKELGHQLKQKFDEEKKILEKAKCEAQAVLKIVKSEEESEIALQQKLLEKKTEYRIQLQDQIINKYKEKQENYKQTLKERALLDDALRTIIEEDEMEVRRERQKKVNIMMEIEQFRNARALWTLREKEVLEKEDRAIKEYLRKKEKFDEDEKMKNDNRRKELERKRCIVHQIMSNKQDNTAEEENRVLLKALKEEDDKARKKEEDERLRDLKMKSDMKRAFAQQVDDRLTRIRIQKREDTEYLNKMLREFEEDKKYKQMTIERQKCAKSEYHKSLLKECEETRYRRQMEEQELINLQKLEKKDRSERKTIIEDERIRLLQKHTGDLLGFLPPGFLKQSDLPHLPEQVRDYYTAKQNLTQTFAT